MTRPDAPHITLHHGDALDVLRTLPAASVDAVVTDPPYGLAEHKPATIVAAMTAWCSGDRDHVPDGKGFMGRAWDGFVPPPAVWDECLRVLKPGGHLLCFAGTRTVDLMGLSIRLAGFEIRDAITWMYGSGFPKSLDVGKAIDKAAGAQREVVGVDPARSGRLVNQRGDYSSPNGWSAGNRSADVTAPATDAARQWQGWGTALKPASEPIIVARKPLAGTVAANVLAHGTGALNVDGCRVGAGTPVGGGGGWAAHKVESTEGWDRPYVNGVEKTQGHTSGRWPANVVLSHSPDCADPCQPGCPVAELDAQSGTLKSGALKPYTATPGDRVLAHGLDGRERHKAYVKGADSGGASRYFPTFRYQAKAPTRERPKVDGVAHPTVKPLALMAWLVRLVCPPGGVVLDPFAGSGTTLQAARAEGMAAVGIEREVSYLPLIAHRLGRELAELVVEVAPAEVVEPAEPEPVVDPILELIATTPARRPALLAIWREHEHAWTDVHTAAVKARLTGVSA